MTPSDSWSLPSTVGINGANYRRDRIDNTNVSHSSGHSSNSTDRFAIDGLILDRSISAPPSEQGLSLMSDDKPWSYSGELSFTRATWRDATDSLYSLPMAKDTSSTSTWASPSRSKPQVHSNNQETIHEGSIVPSLSFSPLPLNPHSSTKITKNQNLFNNTVTNSSSDPTITGLCYDMNSNSLLEPSPIEIMGPINQNATDQWNQYGLNLRRPASTGIIGRNFNKGVHYSVSGNFNNSSGNQMGSLQPVHSENYIYHSQTLSPGSSLNASRLVATGSEQEPARGFDSTIAMTSPVFYSKEHDNATNRPRNDHNLQRFVSQQTNSKFEYDSITNQPIRVDNHGQRNLRFMQHSYGHPISGDSYPHSQRILNQGDLTNNCSRNSSKPIHHLNGRGDATLNKEINGQTFQNSNHRLIFINQPASECENPNMIYRKVITDDHVFTTYPTNSTHLSANHGDVTYFDSTSFSSNGNSTQQQQNLYAAATLPISPQHAVQLSSLSSAYTYLVFQPQMPSSIYLSPQEHINFSQSKGHGHNILNPTILLNPDNTLLSSMQNLSIHGRTNKDGHEVSTSNTEKMKRNKINKYDLCDSKKSDPTSNLLEEFRIAKNQSWTSFTIKGHIAKFAQDQNGSRFIQQRLEVADDDEKRILLEELLLSIHQIQNDVFGNYVIQKLLEVGTSDMKDKLKQSLVGQVVPLSKMIYGCRVVQKALDSLDNEDIAAVVREFKGNLVECILDQNGNHVIQKCIEVFNFRAKSADSIGDSDTAIFLRQNCQCIIDTSLESLPMLSCHPFGCRVIQRIIEHCVEPNFTRVLDTISACHTDILDDQYGNYVIQHLLQYGRVSDKETIMRTVLASGLVKLSRQKYASNVVEKLLKYGTSMVRSMIIKEMLKEADTETGTSAVLLMVRDAYANYVVQTALDVAPEGHIKKNFVQELNNHTSQLRKYTFAKHIVAKLGSSS